MADYLYYGFYPRISAQLCPHKPVPDRTRTARAAALGQPPAVPPIPLLQLRQQRLHSLCHHQLYPQLLRRGIPLLFQYGKGTQLSGICVEYRAIFKAGNQFLSAVYSIHGHRHFLFLRLYSAVYSVKRQVSPHYWSDGSVSSMSTGSPCVYCLKWYLMDLAIRRQIITSGWRTR